MIFHILWPFTPSNAGCGSLNPLNTAWELPQPKEISKIKISIYPFYTEISLFISYLPGREKFPKGGISSDYKLFLNARIYLLLKRIKKREYRINAFYDLCEFYLLCTSKVIAGLTRDSEWGTCLVYNLPGLDPCSPIWSPEDYQEWTQSQEYVLTTGRCRPQTKANLILSYYVKFQNAILKSWALLEPSEDSGMGQQVYGGIFRDDNI